MEGRLEDECRIMAEDIPKENEVGTRGITVPTKSVEEDIITRGDSTPVGSEA